MAKITIPTRFSIVVEDVPRAMMPQARVTMEVCARRMQERIAFAFEREKYGGWRALGRNTIAYNAFKARNGFDPRRGHRTGALQSALRDVQMWSVSSSGSTLTLEFSTAPLLASVPYAEHYQEFKAPLGLETLQKSWQVDCARALRRLFDLPIAGVRISRERRGRRTRFRVRAA